VTTTFDPIAPFRLDGKVAVVTGASSGLGDRFARVLDAVGARVVVAARRADRLEALAADLTDAVVVPADLAVAEDRERLAQVTLETCGRLDVLVNNAGIGVLKPFMELSAARCRWRTSRSTTSAA
jgi:short-subunit dehydrogenase